MEKKSSKKEKNVKETRKTKKVENKVVKETRKTKKEENKVVFNKNTKKIIKMVVLLISFFAVALSIFTFVFSTITTLNVANSTKAEILNDNFTVTHIANINRISVVESENLIQGFGNKTLFIIFDIVIPTLSIILIALLLVLLLKKVLDFVTITTKEKELFNIKKINDVEKLACIAETIITIYFVVFKKPSLLFYIFASLLLFLVIALFRKCVENKNSN